MRKTQQGFGVVELLIIIVVIGLIGAVGWKVLSKTDTITTSTASETSKTSSQISSKEKVKELLWQQTADGWQSMQTAPECADQPMMEMPVDISQVTSVLYPGQTRGGNYKSHGGFRFDNATDNKVTVTAPLEGYIVRGSRYLAADINELQYTFDVMNNCGVMYRMGHLRELPENLQKIAETFPEATTSSATQGVSPAVYIEQGSVLATKVGTTNDGNTFFDWGIYDYRQKNVASKTAEYMAAHPQAELTSYAVCWLNDWLPTSDSGILNGLPAADPNSGKTSDYCR